jgi:hypothetical protein
VLQLRHASAPRGEVVKAAAARGQRRSPAPAAKRPENRLRSEDFLRRWLVELKRAGEPHAIAIVAFVLGDDAAIKPYPWLCWAAEDAAGTSVGNTDLLSEEPR